MYINRTYHSPTRLSYLTHSINESVKPVETERQIFDLGSNEQKHQL